MLGYLTQKCSCQSIHNIHISLMISFNQAAIAIAPIPPLSSSALFADNWELQMIGNFRFINCNALLLLFTNNDDISLAMDGGVIKLSGSLFNLGRNSSQM